MIYLAYTAMFLASLASSTYLVVTEHYGWAWIPFVLVASIELKSKR